MSIHLWTIVRWVRNLLGVVTLVTGTIELPKFIYEYAPGLYGYLGEIFVGALAVVCSFLLAIVIVGPKRVLVWRRFLPRHVNWEEQHAQDAALDGYLNQMQQWIDDAKRPLHHSQPGDKRRGLARTQTLTVLRRLGPNGKRHVLEFLYEHDLIDKDDSIVRLARADFSNAHLASIQLNHVDLEFSNLSGADLSSARLSALVTTSSAVDMAQQKGVHGRDFDTAIATTKLSSANLSGAVLRETRLAGCDLTFADFNGANLKDADLRAADSRAAHNLTQKQLNKAYGTHQQESVSDTELPDYLQVPAAWRKPISEQRKDRKRS